MEPQVVVGLCVTEGWACSSSLIVVWFLFFAGMVLHECNYQQLAPVRHAVHVKRWLAVT